MLNPDSHIEVLGLHNFGRGLSGLINGGRWHIIRYNVACIAGRICERASAKSHQLHGLIIRIKNMFLNDKVKCTVS